VGCGLVVDWDTVREKRIGPINMLNDPTLDVRGNCSLGHNEYSLLKFLTL
jgi:hypothetical protein